MVFKLSKKTNYRAVIGLPLISCFFIYIWIDVYYLKEKDFSWYDKTLNYEVFTSSDERVHFLREFLASEGYGGKKQKLSRDWLQSTDNITKMYAMKKLADLDDAAISKEYVELVRRIILREDEYFSFVMWNMARASIGSSQGRVLIRKKYDYSKLAGLRGFYNAALASGNCKSARKWIGDGYYNNAKNGYLDDVAAWVVVSKKCQHQASKGFPYDKWQGNTRMFDCVLRHYKEAEDYFGKVVEKYVHSKQCGGAVDEWISLQMSEDSSFFSQISTLKFLSAQDLKRKNFFKHDMECVYVPFVFYSENIRKTKYYKDCMTMNFFKKIE